MALDVFVGSIGHERLPIAAKALRESIDDLIEAQVKDG